MPTKSSLMMSTFSQVIMGMLVVCSLSSAKDGKRKDCATAESYLQVGQHEEAEVIFDNILKKDPGEKCALSGLKRLQEYRCKNVDSFLQYGLLDKAEEAISLALKKVPGEKCAQKRLKELCELRCSNADKYLQEGLLDEAKVEYSAALKIQPNAKCGIHGLDTIKLNKCKIAELMLKLGDVAGAREIYKILLASDVKPTCASDGLIALPTNFEIAMRSAEIGDYDGAWKQLLVVVAENPDNVNHNILAKQNWYRWRKMKLWIVEYLSSAGALILMLLLALTTVGAAVLRCRLRLDVGDFEIGSGQITDGTSGSQNPIKSVTARFEQELVRLGKEDKITQLDVINEPITTPSLPADISSIPEEARGLWGFITKLFAPRVLTISGCLEYNANNGAGLYVKIVRSGTNKIWGSYTVWESDLVPGINRNIGPNKPSIDEYLILTEVAAILAYWTIHSHKKRFYPGDPLRSFRKVFGTSDRYSYYIGRLGAQKIGKDDADAEKLLRKALAYDYQNYIAWFNLAMIKYKKWIDYLRTVAEKAKIEHDLMLAYLEQVMRLTEKDSLNLTRIFAKYRFGVIELSKCYLDNKCDKSHLKQAKEYLDEAYESAKKVRRKRGSAISEEFLIMIEIPLRDATQLLTEDRYSYPEKWLDDLYNKGVSYPRVLYNIACHICIMVYFEKYIYTQHIDKPALLASAEYYLEQAKMTESVIAEIEKNDPCLKILREYTAERP